MVQKTLRLKRPYQNVFEGVSARKKNVSVGVGFRKSPLRDLQRVLMLRKPGFTTFLRAWDEFTGEVVSVRQVTLLCTGQGGTKGGKLRKK